MLTKVVGATRQIYECAAMLALINIIGLVALCAYLGISGELAPDHLRRAVAALREEPAKPAQHKEESEQDAPVVQTEGGEIVDNFDVEARMNVEILQREAERVRVELDQRLALNQSILLKVQNEREAFKREQQELLNKREKAAQESRDEGFEKQVEIFESLKPKIAVQHLLSMQSPEDAAKILMALDPDRARKIVEAARKDPELTQMEAVLRRIRDVAEEMNPPMDATGQEDGGN